MKIRIFTIAVYLALFTVTGVFADVPGKAEALFQARFIQAGTAIHNEALERLVGVLESAEGNVKEILQCIQAVSVAGSNTSVIVSLAEEASRRKSDVKNFNILLFIAVHHGRESFMVQIFISDYVNGRNVYPAFRRFVDGEISYADLVKATKVDFLTLPVGTAQPFPQAQSFPEASEDVVRSFIEKLAGSPQDVREAASRITAMFRQSGRVEKEDVLIGILATLGDSPRNLPVLVELSRFAASEDSSLPVYQELIRLASKAKFASTEFTRLAEDEKRLGSGSLGRLRVAASLTAAQSEAECEAVMKAYERSLKR